MNTYEWCTEGFEIPEGVCPGNCQNCSLLRRLHNKRNYDDEHYQIYDMYKHGMSLTEISSYFPKKSQDDIINAIAYFDYKERSDG